MTKCGFRTRVITDRSRSNWQDNTDRPIARDALGFKKSKMPNRMGKYVRANHILSETHWMKAELVPNRLAKN